MKAVIVENRDEYSVVLLENGTFEKMRLAGAVGEEISLPQAEGSRKEAAEERHVRRRRRSADGRRHVR